MVLDVHRNPPLFSKVRNHVVFNPDRVVQADADLVNPKGCGRPGCRRVERPVIGTQHAFGIVSRLWVIRRLKDRFAK